MSDLKKLREEEQRLQTLVDKRRRLLLDAEYRLKQIRKRIADEQFLLKKEKAKEETVLSALNRKKRP